MQIDLIASDSKLLVQGVEVTLIYVFTANRNSTPQTQSKSTTSVMVFLRFVNTASLTYVASVTARVSHPIVYCDRNSISRSVRKPRFILAKIDS